MGQDRTGSGWDREGMGTGTGWDRTGRGWDGIGWNWMGLGWNGMGRDRRAPSAAAPTHRDVGVVQLQAVQRPAGGGQEGGDGQGEGQAARRLGPDNPGLQKRVSGWCRAGQPQRCHCSAPSPTHQVGQRREVHADSENAAEEPQARQARPRIGNQEREVAIAGGQHSQEQQAPQQHGALGRRGGGWSG